jgi:FkbM family methyltransferase
MVIPVGASAAACGVPDGAKVISTTTDPSFRIAVFASDDIVSAKISQNGVWEAGLLPLLRAGLQPHADGTQASFVDIGANLGIFSLYAAMLGAHVTAIEPMPRNARLIAASACLNNLSATSLSIYNVGLHTSPGECTVVGETTNQGDGVMDCSPEAVAATASSRVSVRRLDSGLITSPIDVMKVSYPFIFLMTLPS